MRLHRVVYRCGVTKAEVAEFIARNEIVGRWLGKFKDSPITFEKYSRGLTMFFKWLRECKGLTISPSAFLETVAVKRNDVRPSERC